MSLVPSAASGTQLPLSQGLDRTQRHLLFLAVVSPRGLKQEELLLLFISITLLWSELCIPGFERFKGASCIHVEYAFIFMHEDA